jgi:hypothetical protein
LRRGAAVLCVRYDDLGCLHVDGSLAGMAQRRSQHLRRQTLASGDETVADARGEVAEEAHSDAQLSIFTRGSVDRREQRSTCSAGGQQRLDDVAVTF